MRSVISGSEYLGLPALKHGAGIRALTHVFGQLKSASQKEYWPSQFQAEYQKASKRNDLQEVSNDERH